MGDFSQTPPARRRPDRQRVLFVAQMSPNPRATSTKIVPEITFCEVRCEDRLSDIAQLLKGSRADPNRRVVLARITLGATEFWWNLDHPDRSARCPLTLLYGSLSNVVGPVVLAVPRQDIPDSVASVLRRCIEQAELKTEKTADHDEAVAKQISEEPVPQSPSPSPVRSPNPYVFLIENADGVKPPSVTRLTEPKKLPRDPEVDDDLDATAPLQRLRCEA